MNDLSEAEIQVLIAMGELDAAHTPATVASLAECRGYFRSTALDWTDALSSLARMKMLALDGQAFSLTSQGAAYAAQLLKQRPRMWYFYNDFYRATAASAAFASFCERVFGRNFSQHGFSDMAQLGKLLDVARLGPANRVLDLGCGNGAMAEYIADCTGAHISGIDFSPEALRQACRRSQGNPKPAFFVMSMDALTFAPGSFDTLISIDTLYFVDIEPMIRRMKDLLAPGGQMLIFYAHGAGPGADRATFPKETLAPHRTPLGEALVRTGLSFRTWDFTRADYEHARLKKQVIEELGAALEAEGNLFLYKGALGEANGVMGDVEAGVQARYLYHIVAP